MEVEVVEKSFRLLCDI